MYVWIGKMAGLEHRLHRWAGFIPRWAIRSACYGLSWLLFMFAVKWRKKVLSNMKQLLQTTGTLQLCHYCRSYFYQVLLTLYEIGFDSSGLLRHWEKRFEIEGECHLIEALKHNKGVILTVPHIGNFFFYYWYLSQKYLCLTVATAGSEELRPLYLKFQRLGCRGLDYDNVPPLQLIRRLRSHLKQNGVVFLMGDFYRRSFPPAFFFNRATRSPNGAAHLALEYGVPILSFYGYRTKGFCHRLVFDAPLDLNGQFQTDQRYEATNALNKILEQKVKMAPDQWFYWFNTEERWDCHPERKQSSKGIESAS
ncbi:lysophospholipid acyltransferase family protein [Paenibacillus naphthalenovorans]|uniref:lysophospholipid acyltransferase family protein n=1 Tax=Paenibacillus naphthalenovorans TaxID=162209 RepID=UPI000890A921|nr:lysophospholipid acyltransferase family protein [Paenibacillus naphthalenovorans]SDI83960.1 KDO2-lipid IV(A) lauroyltransferase [Paenibacillus naphthalenovorans]